MQKLHQDVYQIQIGSIVDAQADVIARLRCHQNLLEDRHFKSRINEVWVRVQMLQRIFEALKVSPLKRRHQSGLQEDENETTSPLDNVLITCGFSKQDEMLIAVAMIIQSSQRGGQMQMRDLS